jgi:sec-independent protein translocase protein TatC
MSDERDHEQQEEGLQMSFLDHLDELRVRIIHSVVGVGICFAVCFLFAKPIFHFLEKPVKQQLRKARIQGQAHSGTVDLTQVKEGELLNYTFPSETAIGGVRIPAGTTVPVKAATVNGQMTLALDRRWAVGSAILDTGKPITTIFKEGENPEAATPAPTGWKAWLASLYKGGADAGVYSEEDRLIMRSVTGAFTLYVQVALYTGIALAIPFLLFQVWAFISPGLYQHEKKYITPVLTMAAVFFVLGASFAYKIAFPAACDYLLAWQTDGGFRTLLDAEDYFNLIILIMLGLGLVFQIPTLSFLLGRIGLLTPGMMIRTWRYAVISIAIIAAVLTPTPDAFNMLVFMGPMLGLYFVSIGIVWLFGKPRKSDAEVGALAHSE